jgi:mannose-6-phosphate isomerase-like protein (cupin superfamily)
MQGAIMAIHVDDVPIERMERREGWAISEFRLPVSGAQGSATTAFHSIFRPGSTHAKHLHHDSDEIAVYLQGHGVVGQGDSRAEVGAGHCRLMPRGSEHFFFNETTAEDAVVIGFYIGAASVVDSGYECCGDVRSADLDMPRAGLNEGIHLRLQDVGPLDTNGFDAYAAVEVRLPVGSHNGSANALIQAVIAPGGALDDHRLDNCEQLYFVVRGSGVARSGAHRLPVRAGHFILVPKEAEFGLRNTDSGAPLELIGVLTGAGSLADAGYVRPDRPSKEVSTCR